MLNAMLTERALPPLRSRSEMLEILQREEYGFLPAPPDVLTFSAEREMLPGFCAGKATCSLVIAQCIIGGREYDFPFYVTLPTDGRKHPFFVHINFRPNIPDQYQPTEELVDNGFAVLSFCYNDVTLDNGDFTDGLAGVLYPEGQRPPEGPGKIAMWAWAAQRVLDYAQTRSDVLDLNCAIVCGHSRLGKTALFAAATDPRFAFAYSNDSGCSGAAISRGKVGESLENICSVFPYWFCENYRNHMGRVSSMPFDQHYLLASIAPRKVLVGSASEDSWADPLSEQLGCAAASPAFEKGFAYPDRPAEIGEEFFAGDIGYHLRRGSHYLGREDWQKLIKFIRLHSGLCNSPE